MFLWPKRLEQGAVVDVLDTGRAQKSGVGEVLKPRYSVRFSFIAEFREISIVQAFRDGSERVCLVFMWSGGQAQVAIPRGGLGHRQPVGVGCGIPDYLFSWVFTEKKSQN